MRWAQESANGVAANVSSMAPEKGELKDKTVEDKAHAESLLADFTCESILNQDQNGRRINVLGHARGEQGLLLIERAPFPSELEGVKSIKDAFTNVGNLGANDIYNWYMASVAQSAAQPDLKVNLIWPCRESHIAKYSAQPTRIVTETPEIFAKYVRPYMVKKTEEGRLNWVFNIIEGRQEQQDIILRSSNNLGHDPEGFLLLPDMNWDRTTMTNLRLLALVERRDLLSLRDLRKKDVPWLRTMLVRLFETIAAKYDGIEADMLKAYLHYQPTYYHFHIHIVSAALEPNATQAVGKAFSLHNIISQLETLTGGPEAGMMDCDLTYSLGEKSELWEQVYLPLKEGREPI